MFLLFPMPQPSPLPPSFVEPDPDLYKPEESADAKDQMTLKITVRDRRMLAGRAAAERMSPTQWLVKKIYEAPVGKGKTQAAIVGAISFVLDRRREEAAARLAKEMGFHKTEDLAEDLLKQALLDPKGAEEFLFGSLRNPALAPKKTEAPTEENEQKKAA